MSKEHPNLPEDLKNLENEPYRRVAGQITQKAAEIGKNAHNMHPDDVERKAGKLARLRESLDRLINGN